ncbi:hypothetical protein [Xanthomonas indica]|uniref:Uncharacterized protein n=1 Tax=Xanthomonas indica TaxID=2912242 RepID=A0AAU8I5F9_9XANT|nr:hypothetical protein [Xanthomonas indica]MCI2263219.1 hypothetical protein [Xanthomonas indica]
MNSDSKLRNKSSAKMKVLALQELEGVSGGLAAWSTDSINCGGVTKDEWSTASRGCPKETVDAQIGS